MDRIDKDLPIGGTFELDGKTYMVIKNGDGTNETNQSCIGCAFHNTLTCGRYTHRPACALILRKDKTSVIFKEVKTTIGPTVQTQFFEEPAAGTFLPIGSIFTKNNNKYIVAKGFCSECSFENIPENCNNAPSCFGTKRKDETCVIFKLLSEVTSVSAETTDGSDTKKNCDLNENEFTYDNKKYIAIGSTRSSARCKLCAFNTIINGKNICCTSLDQGKRPPCFERERRDAKYVYFIEKETITNNINQKTNNMKNYIEKIKSLILPSTNNDFVFTMDGKLGLRKDDKIISYDKTTNEFTEYPSDFGIEIPVFEISTPSNQIKEGDVIKHNNSWCIVKSVKDNNISVLSYTGTSKKVQVVNNFLLGQKVVRKIMSFDIQGNNNNNMNPMMMLALMDGKDSDDIVKTIFTMQMMQNNNKGFNPMVMLMLNKSIDMKDFFIMNAISGMSGMQMPFFGNSSDSPASK